MVEVLVEHDYIAKEPDELTIRKGDIIKQVAICSGGWWEGVLNEKRGVFPDNFVKLLSKDPSNVILRNRKDTARIRQCRVVFSYKQDHEDELNLSVGDIIEILGEEEEGWWRGLLKGKEGVFPSNFVEEIAPIVSKPRPSSRDTNSASQPVENIIRTPSLPAKPSKIICQVKYPYKAQNEDELTLKEGDLVTLISKDGEDIGWWKGEIHGQIGVFPDNFVVVLPSKDEKPIKDEKRVEKSSDVISKATSSAIQRRSLEKQPEKLFKVSSEKLDTKHDKPESEISSKANNPPVPGKKPTVPLKKSPSGSGFVSGIKKKIAEMADAVDGASASKPSSAVPKEEIHSNEQNPESAFDNLDRRPLLSDVRATRAKGPGRRPPSVYREIDIGMTNGNGADHANVDPSSDQLSITQLNSQLNQPSEVEAAEVKPKLREWEKHKAPWLAEMKMNQAKRSSTSPGPENRLKLTPEKNSAEVEDTRLNKTSPFEKESSPVDMSKSMPSLGNKLKTPPNELEKVAIRLKPKLPVPARPTSNSHEAQTSKAQTVSVSPPVVLNRSPSPHLKPVEKALEKTSVPEAAVNDSSAVKNSSDQPETVTFKQYSELLERVQKLETIVEKQGEIYLAKIEELRGKLQIESDLRMMLQAELEKVSQCVLQV